MLFNSYLFIFLFLPLVLFGWYALNRAGWDKASKLFLLGMSLWFYGYYHVWYLVLLCGSILLNYGIGKLFEKDVFAKSRLAHGLLVSAGAGVNLGLLFYYKYLNFTLANVNKVFHAGFSLREDIVLPLGISFFTFQQLSYVLDAAKGEKTGYSLLDYAVYVAYFPQLIAGPIVLHGDLVPQFHEEGRKRFDWDYFAQGLILFIVGLGKKVLLADSLGRLVDRGYGNVEGLDAYTAVFVMVSYTFQIFFDFSGYCDMALGIGKMMHIDLPVNFDSPYKSGSVREFWRRWHITLNAFFTRYVYIPLGGSREGRIKTVRNILIVFLLSGIWHGAAGSFVIWGLLHGVMIVLESFGLFDKLPDKIRWVGTFLFVNLAWVWFRSTSISMAVTFFKRLFVFRWSGALFDVVMEMSGPFTYALEEQVFLTDKSRGMLYLVFALLVFCLAAWLCTKKSAAAWAKECGFSGRLATALAVVASLSVISLSRVAIFLYFNF